MVTRSRIGHQAGYADLHAFLQGTAAMLAEHSLPTPTSLRAPAPFFTFPSLPVRRVTVRERPRALALGLSLLLGTGTAAASFVAVPSILEKPKPALVKASAAVLAQRERQLDAMAGELKAALAKKPPKLPPVPKFEPVRIPPPFVNYLQPAAPAAVVVYVKPDKHKKKYKDEHKKKHKDEHKKKHKGEHKDEHEDGPPGGY